MRLLPRDKTGRIEFCEVHLEPWADHAAEIGTTPQSVQTLAELTEAARVALREQQQAQDAAQSATLNLNLALDRMTHAATAIVQQVRSEAARAGNGVYSLANIPAPEKGSPVGSPGRPFRFVAQLLATGAMELTWKCDNPRGSRGTVYQLWRRIDGGELTYVGATGERRFVDDAVPAGSARVEYRLQAVRSTAKGDVAIFNVNLGTTGRIVTRIAA